MAKGEATEKPWQRLFERTKQAGLDLDVLRGVTSDGAPGLIAQLQRGLAWVQHQRCVWHLWRNLGSQLATAASRAAEGLAGAAAEQARQRARDELGGLMHQIIDAASYEQAAAALALLLAHPLGATLGKLLNEHLDRVLVHLPFYYRGLPRVTPEWYWRDFRLRLSWAATIAQIGAGSGRPWSGPSTTTSGPLSGGQSANDIIATPADLLLKWPERHRVQ